MKNVKKIAIAIDFSENSRGAYHYAKSLAKHIGAEIELIHIFTLPVNPDGLHGMAFIPPINEQIENTLMQLHEYAQDPTVKCSIHTGFASDKLVELSKAHAFDLLVVGNRDERGLLTRLFGSVALEVSKKSFCPVLLVPHNANFESINNILYAVSEMSTDVDGIAVTKAWATEMGAKIHFVHVDTTDKNDFLPEVTNLMKDSGMEYSIKELESITVRYGIDVYCKQKPIDLIVSITQNRSFWDSIFHTSITSALAWNSPLPLLVLHKDIVEA